MDIQLVDVDSECLNFWPSSKVVLQVPEGCSLALLDIGIGCCTAFCGFITACSICCTTALTLILLALGELCRDCKFWDMCWRFWARWLEGWGWGARLACCCNSCWSCCCKAGCCCIGCFKICCGFCCCWFRRRLERFSIFWSLGWAWEAGSTSSLMRPANRSKFVIWLLVVDGCWLLVAGCCVCGCVCGCVCDCWAIGDWCCVAACWPGFTTWKSVS